MPPSRPGICVRLSRRCRRTILANVGMGLGRTVVVIGIAATDCCQMTLALSQSCHNVSSHWGAELLRR
jgi:hypothetical protein